MTGRRFLHGGVVLLVGLAGTAVQLMSAFAISLCGLMGETCSPEEDLGMQVAGSGAVSTLAATLAGVAWAAARVEPSTTARVVGALVLVAGAGTGAAALAPGGSWWWWAPLLLVVAAVVVLAGAPAGRRVGAAR